MTRKRLALPAIFFLIWTLLCCSADLVAQKTPERVLKGKITDQAAGGPLTGVFVKIKGTPNGVLSKQDGQYSLKVKNGDTLVFSHIGYASREFAVGNRAILDVKLTVADKVLDDVVVIGYGEVKRKDITGSVATVNLDDLKKAPVPSFDQALAGRVAGVRVSANEGQPGAEMNIVIRGGNSLTQSNSPLYVIDGFPVEDPSLASINPEDIASFTILKDASATAIYGSRGANGVIVIETKRGKSGKTAISYNGSMGVQQVINKMEMMSPYEFVRYQLELNPIDMTTRYLTVPGVTLDDYKNVPALDWQDMLFRNAAMQSHNLSVSGGNAQTKFSLSGSFVNMEGVIINSGYKRGQGRFSLDHTVNKRMKVGINANYASDKNFGQLASEQQSSNNGYSSFLMFQTWGYRPVIPAGDDFNIIDELVDEGVTDMRVNPIISVRNEIRNQYKTSLIVNAYGSYTVAKNLELLVRAGINSRSQKDEGFFNSSTAKGYPSVNNTKGVYGTIENRSVNDWLNENTLTYKKRLNANNSFDVLGGFTMQGRSDDQNGYESQQVPNEDLGLSGLDEGIPGEVISLKSKNTLVSFLGRVNYNFMSKYLFTASFRADGSSKFAPEHRWGYFPSAAIAWRLSREKFMQRLSFVSDAKIRASYGVTGNNRVGDFVRYSSLGMDYGSYYSFGNATPSPSIINNRFGNKDLKWESTRQVDLGIDLSLFNNRITFEADVYRKTTVDLLLNANVPNSTGFSKIYKNVGSIRNDGLEFTLGTVNVKTKKFSWSSDINISFNDNKVMALAEGEESLLSSVSWTGDYNASFLYLAKLGGSASAFYGNIWDGVYQYSDFDKQPDNSYKLKNSAPDNGMGRTLIQPGDIKYRDINNDGIVNDKDFVQIGRGLPVHSGGFNNNFTYGQFSLNVFFQWSYGNNVFNANRLMLDGNGLKRLTLNQFATYADRWTPENSTSVNNRTGGEGPRGIYSSRTMEDGSYIRLKTVSLSYAIPSAILKRIKMQNLSVFAAAQNLVTWTNYSGMDPEASVRNTTLTPGFDYSAYPLAKTLNFGIKATF